MSQKEIDCWLLALVSRGAALLLGLCLHALFLIEPDFWLGYQWLYYDSTGAEKQTRPEDVGVIHTVKWERRKCLLNALVSFERFVVVKSSVLNWIFFSLHALGKRFMRSKRASRSSHQLAYLSVPNQTPWMIVVSHRRLDIRADIWLCDDDSALCEHASSLQVTLCTWNTNPNYFFSPPLSLCILSNNSSVPTFHQLSPIMLWNIDWCGVLENEA